MHQQHRRPLRPAIIVAAVATFAATGTVAAGCSSNKDQYVNCVDDNGIFVDTNNCDDDSSGHYHYYKSHKRHKTGLSAPSNWRSSAIDPRDAAARTKAGLPATGNIGGTKVRGGGFGSGKTSGGS